MNPKLSCCRTARLILALALLSLVAACAVNPVTGRQELHLISEKEEIAMGQKHYTEGQQTAGGEFILDPALTAYVRTVLSKLTKVSDRPQLPFEIIVANDSTPNAWAMPGGKMAINRGLLLELNSEAELAAVLSHEATHATARHGARAQESAMLVGLGAVILSTALSDSSHPQLADYAIGLGASLVSLKYSREHELEADHYGIETMKRAGYDATAAVRLQETFLRLAGEKQQNWLSGLFSTHPPSQERLMANERYAYGQIPPVFVGEAEYQAAIATLRKMKPAYDAYDAAVKAVGKKDAEQAFSAVNKAINLEPREALFYALRGQIQERRGDRAAAEIDYDDALKRNPNYYGPWLSRGKLRLAQKRYREGEADIERSMRLLPTGTGQLLLGQLAMRDGRRDRAMKLLQPLAQNGNKEAAYLIQQITNNSKAP